MAANFKGYFVKFKRRLSLSYLGYLFIYIPLKGKLPSIAPRLLSLAGETWFHEGISPRSSLPLTPCCLDRPALFQEITSSRTDIGVQHSLGRGFNGQHGTVRQ